uniref:Uncharacterized protein n=1 Tax=Oryza sativa subsp. japonica TaxID=39947 RepID=Q6K5L2_ORYSJ|nr:hypothetical protein [Oryza sativa Japonica Group]BAD22113.1 hypothetical protein [Oryza sativa Japonica Group]
MPNTRQSFLFELTALQCHEHGHIHHLLTSTTSPWLDELLRLMYRASSRSHVAGTLIELPRCHWARQATDNVNLEAVAQSSTAVGSKQAAVGASTQQRRAAGSSMVASGGEPTLGGVGRSVVDDSTGASNGEQLRAQQQ